MRRASIVVALLLIAACGSSGGLGDLGTILGSPSQSQPSDVTGVVNSVDLSAQRIDLDVRYVNNLRQSTGVQSIYYDNRTRVEYGGKTYQPGDLERGDEVMIRGYNDNSRYYADVITVTRNVRQ